MTVILNGGWKLEANPCWPQSLKTPLEESDLTDWGIDFRTTQ
jgi:hypothetical protein